MDCQLELQMSEKEADGCFLVFALSSAPIRDGITFCNVSHVPCVGKQENSTYLNDQTKFTMCRDQCKKKCHEIKYKLHPTIFPFNFKFYQHKEEHTQYDKRVLTKNIVEVEIKYNRIGNSVLKHRAEYPLEIFLSDIGGMLGLSLGASILTVYEICELFAEVICKSCKQKCARETTSYKLKDIV